MDGLVIITIINNDSDDRRVYKRTLQLSNYWVKSRVHSSMSSNHSRAQSLVLSFHICPGFLVFCWLFVSCNNYLDMRLCLYTCPRFDLSSFVICLQDWVLGICQRTCHVFDELQHGQLSNDLYYDIFKIGRRLFISNSCSFGSVPAFRI